MTEQTDVIDGALEPARTPHLVELFDTGIDIPIVYPGKPETFVWVERPSPDQHDECMKKARADRARRYYELTADDSDEKMALLQEINGMDKPALVQAMLERDIRFLERQALNEVLFSEEHGSDWGKEGEDYSALLEGLQTRIEEITSRNDELRAADAEDGIVAIEDDPEIKRLSKVQEQFESDVNARKTELVEAKKVEIAVAPLDKLRADLMEERINLECELEWFATFKFEQLYRAVRWPDDHSRFYFQKVSQIRGLPRPVQEQLFDALNQVDINAEELKNSLTPLSS